MRAFRLGITGKIGSGKSTLSAIAADHGIKVLESDSIAKEVMNSDPEVRTNIELLFGPEAYSGGALNRPFLASKIFTDDSSRVQLEAIVHPATLKVFEEAVRTANPGEIVALESAILFQTGLDEIFDAVILVDASDEDIIAREESSGKFSGSDIMNRLKQQYYNNSWKEDADFVIANNSTESNFIARCESLVEIIKVISRQNLPEMPLRQTFE